MRASVCNLTRTYVSLITCLLRLSFEQAGGSQDKMGILQYVKDKHKGALMPLGKLLSLIDEVYQDKIKADEIDDRGELAFFT